MSLHDCILETVDDRVTPSVSTPHKVTTCPLFSPDRIISGSVGVLVMAAQKCAMAIIIIVKIFRITRDIVLYRQIILHSV